MKQYRSKLIVFLVLGTCVNITVAWGCAYWIIPFRGYIQPSQNPIVFSFCAIGETWPRRIFQTISQPGSTTIIWWNELRDPMSYIHEQKTLTTYFPNYYEQALAPTWSSVGFDDVQSRGAKGSWSAIVECAQGWPFLALKCVTEMSYDSDVKKYKITKIGSGIELQDKAWPKKIGWENWNTGPTPDYAILPLRPIWPGFAINTIFYASLLWLVTLGPFTARKVIRRKRGFCIECGYDLRGDFSTGCPECGFGREN